MNPVEWFRSSRGVGAAAVALAAIVMLLGVASPRPQSSVHAEVREAPAREAFLSGGARSEIVLKEILETLKQIDGRLERFEAALRNAEQQAAAAREPAGSDAPATPEESSTNP